MAVYEGRDQIYLTALATAKLVPDYCDCPEQHHLAHEADPRPALQILQLDQALCPRTGSEHHLKQDLQL